MTGGHEIGLWALLVTASITDLIWGKVFNWTTFGFLLVGIVFRSWTSGWEGFFAAGAAVVVAFVLFYPLYLIKAMAAGDIKLLMAVGGWAETKLVAELGAIAILVGALVGLFILLRKNGFKGGFQSVMTHAKAGEKEIKSLRMPFAPAFLCAFILVQIMERFRWSIL